MTQEQRTALLEQAVYEIAQRQSEVQLLRKWGKRDKDGCPLIPRTTIWAILEDRNFFNESPENHRDGILFSQAIYGLVDRGLIEKLDIKDRVYIKVSALAAILAKKAA